MARFTKALRERIVREFTARHNGRFDPAVFVEEVRQAGPSHEAYEWFQWDDEAAAEAGGSQRGTRTPGDSAGIPVQRRDELWRRRGQGPRAGDGRGDQRVPDRLPSSRPRHCRGE